MFSLVIIALTAMPLSVTASTNSTCRKINHPSSPQSSAPRFTLVTVGLTGAGKSTAIDILAGGHNISTPGKVYGASQTEDSCPFNFEFMDGKNPEAGHERWEVVDTPGYGDTGGKVNMIGNDEVVLQALDAVGSVDAILFLWKYDEKFTRANLGAFVELRSTFDVSIWKRVIFVYSFWDWMECVEFLCTCKHHSDLAKVHQETMDAAFNHTNRVAGDPRCNDTIMSDCFPEAKDIPFIGSDYTLEKVKRMRDLGCDPLNADANSSHCPPASCPINSAAEFRRLRSILQNLTTTPDYQKLNTIGLTNSWVSCENASSNLNYMINNCTDVSSCQDMLANITAKQVQRCIDGGIATETSKVEWLLDGRFDLQAHIAFFMPKKEYVAAPFFSPDVAKLLDEYPDYLTYKTCVIAADGNNQDAAVLTTTVTACWTRLASAAVESRFSPFNTSISNLTASYKSRSYSLRMALALNMMMNCQADKAHCPGAKFVSKVLTAEEEADLASLTGFASQGRCCHRQGMAWIPQAGVCNNSNVVWNQTNIDCLRYCSLADLKVPNCSIKTTGEILCELPDVFGQWQLVKGALKSSAENTYIHNRGTIALKFNLTDQVSFVINNAAQQHAECHQGEWMSSWVLPRARQVRSCAVCQKDTECLSANCIPGKGLQNNLWLAGDSVHAGLCTDTRLCGVQQDTNCVKPTTPFDDPRFFFQARDCSQKSCKLDDCFQKFGTCHGVCDCPLKAKTGQPAHCQGSVCETSECCASDPTVETCSRATGRPCVWYGSQCDEIPGAECVELAKGIQSWYGRETWECICKPGKCARNYGAWTGWCADKCSLPQDCGPDTGGKCDKILAVLGVNTCASWRGNARCEGGKCLCNNNGCAVNYSDENGKCYSEAAGQLTTNSSGGRFQVVKVGTVALLAGLLVAFSTVFLARRRYSCDSSTLVDPLLVGEVLVED